MEAEDYVDPTGRVKLLQEDSSPAIKVESGFLNSFFQFMSTDPVIQKPRTPEEDEAANEAAKCVKDCYIEGLITESKFLHTESLQQLVKHIILGMYSRVPKSVEKFVFRPKIGSYLLLWSVYTLYKNFDGG